MMKKYSALYLIYLLSVAAQAEDSAYANFVDDFLNATNHSSISDLILAEEGLRRCSIWSAEERVDASKLISARFAGLQYMLYKPEPNASSFFINAIECVEPKMQERLKKELNNYRNSLQDVGT